MWTFLSKDQDEYIGAFAAGCGARPIDVNDFVYENSQGPIVLRGILKHKLMSRCLQDGRTFYYMDSGYFGNNKNPQNPRGYKRWHRIVRNDLQHGDIIARPDDRWLRLGIKLNPWKKSGRQILLAVPDGKPCKFYGIDREQWINDTVATIKAHTDRPIIVRDRAASRRERVLHNTLEQALQNDIFALVTYNSIAAVESILAGIPAFVLAPSHAAAPVALRDLTKIDQPYYPDHDKLYAWACHLAYGQFHVKELRNGAARQILEEHQ